MKRYVWRNAALLLAVLAGAGNTQAQFENIERVVERVEAKFTADFGPILPPEKMVEGYELKVIQGYLVEPLKWETEKLSTRVALLELLLEKRKDREAELSAELNDLNEQLFSRSISRPDDLSSLMNEGRAMKRELEIAAAEVDGLRKAIEASKADERMQIERKQAEVAIRAQEELLRAKTMELEQRTKMLRKQNLISEAEVQREEQVLAAEKAKLETLVYELEKIRIGSTPELLQELNRTAAMKEKLEQQVASEALSRGDFVNIQKILLAKQRLSSDLDSIGNSTATLRDQLEQLALEQSYLKHLIDRYETAIEGKNAEKEGDSE